MLEVKLLRVVSLNLSCSIFVPKATFDNLLWDMTT